MIIRRYGDLPSTGDRFNVRSVGKAMRPGQDVEVMVTFMNKTFIISYTNEEIAQMNAVAARTGNRSWQQSYLTDGPQSPGDGAA